LALTIRKNGIEPGWEVADNIKHYSMNLVGQVKIGNAVVTDANDKVAAFDAMGRCMGLANISYNATTAKSQLFMTLFNDQTDIVDIGLTFKLWHRQTGQVLLLETDRKVKFNHSSIVGSVDDPVVMTAGSQYYQELELDPGWNWISLNVDNNSYRDVINMLNQYQWQDGDIVTDDTEDFTLVYKSSLGTWLANNTPREGYSISPQRSYRVYVKNYVNVEIKGYPLRDENQRKITVEQGWNNIGYTPMVNLPVTTALADYAASEGDVVKSREEFAIYTEESVGGGYWSGSLQYMKPGEGYMLYRKGEGKVKFFYPYYEPGSNFFEHTVARSRGWQSDYGRNMTMVATANGIDLQEGDRLVVFCNGEQRGEAALVNGSLFFLTISGEEKAPLSFAIERDGELIATTAEVMTYESNTLKGSLDTPTAILFVENEAGDGTWHTLEGYKLSGKPSHKGVFIHNGKKVVIK
jgi:hypothetical protein